MRYLTESDLPFDEDLPSAQEFAAWLKEEAARFDFFEELLRQAVAGKHGPVPPPALAMLQQMLDERAADQRVYQTLLRTLELKDAVTLAELFGITAERRTELQAEIAELKVRLEQLPEPPRSECLLGLVCFQEMLDAVPLPATAEPSVHRPRHQPRRRKHL